MTRHAAFAILVRIPITLALAGAFGVALVRLAPGFGVDEREMDTRYGSDALASIRATQSQPVWAWASDYSSKFVHGDWGVSTTFGIPVRQLLAERWAVSLVSITAGLALAWIAALLLAGTGTMFRWLDVSGSAASFGLLSIPAGLVAVAIFFAGAPVALGIAIAVFPQVFGYMRELAQSAMSQPCVCAAAARGIGRVGLLMRHVGALARPQLISLLGASAATAVGAAIPMEALCDSPGLGQLAWRAATARDLTLLVPLILLITLTIQAANAVAELLHREPETAA